MLARNMSRQNVPHIQLHHLLDFTRQGFTHSTKNLAPHRGTRKRSSSDSASSSTHPTKSLLASHGEQKEEHISSSEIDPQFKPRRRRDRWALCGSRFRCLRRSGFGLEGPGSRRLKSSSRLWLAVSNSWPVKSKLERSMRFSFGTWGINKKKPI